MRAKHFFLTAFVVVSAPQARCAPLPAFDVPTAISRANLIVVGQYAPRPVHASLPADTGRALGDIRVDRVLYSDLPVHSHEMVRVAGDIQVGYGMFFLKREGDNLVVVEGARGDAPAAPPGFENGGHATRPLAAVAAELVSVFDLPEPVAGNPDSRFAPDVRPGATIEVMTGKNGTGADIAVWRTPSQTQNAEEVYEQAYLALSSIPPDIVVPLLRQQISSHPIGLGHLWAHMALVAAGETTLFPETLPYLLHPRADAQFTNSSLGRTLKKSGSVADVTIPTPYMMFVAAAFSSPSEDIRNGARYQLHSFPRRRRVDALIDGIKASASSQRADAIRALCYIVGSCADEPINHLMTKDGVTELLVAAQAWELTHH